MKASLSIEAIGHNATMAFRHVAQVMRTAGCQDSGKRLLGDLDKYQRWGVWRVGLSGYRIEEIRGKTDYTHANSKGSRGVRIWYVIESGYRYLVHAPTSWNCTERYYCHVALDGTIVRET